jgi:hypothetical protein
VIVAGTGMAEPSFTDISPPSLASLVLRLTEFAYKRGATQEIRRIFQRYLQRGNQHQIDATHQPAIRFQ